MSTVKQLLKDAKAALSDGEWEYAVSLSEEVLKKDKSNYFAYVFLGKAEESLGNFASAKKRYLQAIAVDESNVIAWKGLFVLFRNVKDIIPVVSFKEYFELCARYAQILVQQQLSLIELIDDIRKLRRKYPNCEEEFLDSIRPGTEFGEVVGREIMTPREALKRLLNLKQNSEQQAASKLISAARMKISVNDPDYHFKVNSTAWEVYKNSEVDNLFEQLTNITEDDEKRSRLETSWLEYRIKLLKTMPKEMKPVFFSVVKDMVEGMVVVKHESLMAWTLYFDWKDFSDVDALDMNICLDFIQKFPTEPLAMVIYGWLCSSISSYDSKKISSDILNTSSKDVKKTSIQTPVEEDEEDEESMDQISTLVDIIEDSSNVLSEANILEVLQENIVKCKQSILANRIISKYYLTQKEYQLALPYIRTGTSAVATTIRDLGANLKNSKFDFTLLYATTYTFFEAPKNHSIALSLFDKVLSEDPKNAQAKMGKGLIYIEIKNWKEASRYLRDAVEEFPQNWEIMSAYGWSLLHMGETEQAIEKFKSVLEHSPVDSKTTEFRALNYWRIAKATLQQIKGPQDKDLINDTYKTLIHAVKVSDVFAPAYSLLGYLYDTFFGDESRAFKCYFKALSIDPGDLEAAYFITEKYCYKGNWEAASAVCEALVKTEHVRNSLQSISWPYRVLGMACLERQMYAESVEWFQSAIRVSPSDTESWVGFGQAYLNCGRVEASIKVFHKVLELDESHKYGWYFLAIALAELGQFDESLDILRKITDSSTVEECFLVTEVAVMVEYSFELYHQGFLLKCVDLAHKTIKKIEIITCTISTELHNVWLSLFKSLQVFVMIESQVDRLPLDSLVNIFNAVVTEGNDPFFEKDNVSLDSILADEDADNMSIAVRFVVLSAKIPLLLQSSKSLSRTVMAAVSYNIGCAELLGVSILNKLTYRNAAITAFKNSISSQSNNPDAWIGLGIATMELSYQVSQHCFIKAMVLDSRNSSSWHCLAILALKNNDTGLARDLLMKIQSMAPQQSHSWLGLAIIYQKEGLIEESTRMFAHAYVLANGKSKIAQLLFAKDVLTRSLGRGDNERNIISQQQLSSVAFGLSQYLKKSQNDVFATQMAILTFERLHDFDTAEKLALNLATIIEERFERTQNEEELVNFGLIKTQLARLYLGNSDYENAIDTATLAIGILEDGLEVNSALKAAVISNHVVIGLSSFFNSDVDTALNHANTLLSLSQDSSTIAILIFKILYSMDSEEASTIAVQALLDFVESHGNDISITLTLAAFFIMRNRPQELAELAKQLKLAPLPVLVEDHHRDIPFMIQEINKKIKMQAQILPIWQKASFYFPNSADVWDRLSTEITLRVASSGQTQVSAAHLSKKLTECGTLTRLQKAMFLCPWSSESINALKECFR